MKTFYNNKLYHEAFPENRGKYNPAEVRFTKVLTKYSTEYNNSLFVYNMCQNLDMDRKDLIAFFQEMRLFYNDGSPDGDFTQLPGNTEQLDLLFEDTNVTKLDIRRMYRYLDKNVKKDSAAALEDDIDDDDE
jgi:hypothetical protein